MTIKAKVDAIDSFVRTLKSGGQWDDIQAACVMAGWTNLAGALYPLKGAAPTNNGFVDADLDAGIGLAGDASSYINSGRAADADAQNDIHQSAYISSADTRYSGAFGMTYVGVSNAGYTSRMDFGPYANILYANNRCASQAISGASPSTTGLMGTSRASSSAYSVRAGGDDFSKTVASVAPSSHEHYVFGINAAGTASSRTDATLSWYSIGTATDLSALDSAVSTLMSSLRAIDEDGFDRDALSYVRRIEEADGSFLESGVKKAINRFFVGTKKDGTFSALKASCILCGARTIAGALVPLVVDYGPELWSDTAEPTLVLDGGQGGTPAYDATTRTMSFAGTGASVAYPRFIWGGLGIVLGHQYKVVGRLSGDIGNVYSVTLGSADAVQYDSATGVFSSTLTASSVADFRIYLKGTLGSASVTIESLSIIEDSSTPTAYNFTSANYNRETGLIGVPASSTYIDTNRANNADGQNDKHLAVYATTVDNNVNTCYIGTYPDFTQIARFDASNVSGAINSSAYLTRPTAAGFMGVSRGGTLATMRTNGGESSGTSATTTHSALNPYVLGRNTNGTAGVYSAARLAFYSIGSSLDLAALDNRVSNLVTEIAAAIP